MRAYIIRRLLLLIPTLFFLTILVFLALRFIPGDVIDAMIGISGGYFGGDFDTREALIRALGLDVPLHVQYVRWVGGMVLHGTLGTSLYGSAFTIEEQILGRLPVTIELGLLAIAIGLVIALPVGIYSAIRRNTAADYAGRTVAIVGLATPNFWLGVMVTVFPAIWWNWTPPVRMIALSDDLLGNLGVFIIPSHSGHLLRRRHHAAAQARLRAHRLVRLRERVVVLRHAIIGTLTGLQPGLSHARRRRHGRTSAGAARWMLTGDW